MATVLLMKLPKDHMRLRSTATFLVALAGSLVLASPVLAHIDPDPTEAQAGSRLSVGFTVEHGCDGSPTTSLDMRLPDGVTDATPEPPVGWEGSVDDNVVTFTGGPLPDDQELAFNVALTLPPTPDTTVYFPFVQRCEVGEIRWIDVPTDGSGDDLDEPAPAMSLIGPVATPVTSAPTTTVAPESTVASQTTVVAESTDTTTSSSSTSTTIAPVVTEAPLDTTPTTVADANEEDSDTGGLFVPIVVGLALVAGGAAAAFGIRRRLS